MIMIVQLILSCQFGPVLAASGGGPPTAITATPDESRLFLAHGQQIDILDPALAQAVPTPPAGATLVTGLPLGVSTHDMMYYEDSGQSVLFLACGTKGFHRVDLCSSLFQPQPVGCAIQPSNLVQLFSAPLAAGAGSFDNTPPACIDLAVLPSLASIGGAPALAVLFSARVSPTSPYSSTLCMFDMATALSAGTGPIAPFVCIDLADPAAPPVTNSQAYAIAPAIASERVYIAMGVGGLLEVDLKPSPPIVSKWMGSVTSSTTCHQFPKFRDVLTYELGGIELVLCLSDLGYFCEIPVNAFSTGSAVPAFEYETTFFTSGHRLAGLMQGNEMILGVHSSDGYVEASEHKAPSSALGTWTNGLGPGLPDPVNCISMSPCLPPMTAKNAYYLFGRAPGGRWKEKGQFSPSVQDLNFALGEPRGLVLMSGPRTFIAHYKGVTMVMNQNPSAPHTLDPVYDHRQFISRDSQVVGVESKLEAGLFMTASDGGVGSETEHLERIVGSAFVPVSQSTNMVTHCSATPPVQQQQGCSTSQRYFPMFGTSPFGGDSFLEPVGTTQAREWFLSSRRFLLRQCGPLSSCPTLSDCITPQPCLLCPGLWYKDASASILLHGFNISSTGAVTGVRAYQIPYPAPVFRRGDYSDTLVDMRQSASQLPQYLYSSNGFTNYGAGMYVTPLLTGCDSADILSTSTYALLTHPEVGEVSPSAIITQECVGGVLFAHAARMVTGALGQFMVDTQCTPSSRYMLVAAAGQVASSGPSSPLAWQAEDRMPMVAIFDVTDPLQNSVNGGGISNPHMLPNRVVLGSLADGPGLILKQTTFEIGGHRWLAAADLYGSLRLAQLATADLMSECQSYGSAHDPLAPTSALRFSLKVDMPRAAFDWQPEVCIDVVYVNGRLYCAAGRAGVIVLDASSLMGPTPSAPVIVDMLDTPGIASGLVVRQEYNSTTGLPDGHGLLIYEGTGGQEYVRIP